MSREERRASVGQVEGRLQRDGWVPWGLRLWGFRKMCGITLSRAAQEIDPFVRTSHQSLYRLEHLHDPPAGRQQRAVAALACVIYGVHPEVLELSMDDLPAADPRRLLEVLDQMGH